jgi:hypothetical protein
VERSETEEPKCTNPSTLTLDERRMRDRNEKDEPNDAPSKTLIMEPH